MATDYITSGMVGIMIGTFGSKVAFKGIMKKAASIFTVIVAVQLDLVTGTGGNFMRNTMIMFLIGMEGISIIKNLGNLGVKVPKQISNVFAQLKEEPDVRTVQKVELTTKTVIEPKEITETNQESEAK